MTKQFVIPRMEMARQMDYKAWKEGKEVEWIDQLFAFLDEQDDTYKQYKVHWEPKRIGDWEVARKDIPQDTYQRIYYVTQRPGVLEVDRDTGFGDTTILYHYDDKGEPTTWMSDTRAEIMEHVEFLNKLWWCETMKPRVLITGLGLGMAVNAALKHGASHVDVVEINQEVIDIIGPNFEGKPVTIHQGDALEFRFPSKTKWDLAWHDIWPTITEDNIPEMDRLTTRYRHRVKWQACWQRKGCLELRRRSKKLQEALRAGDWETVKELDPDM